MSQFTEENVPKYKFTLEMVCKYKFRHENLWNLNNQLDCKQTVCLGAIFNNYRIRSSITTGLYFSIWVFGWGSIQKIPQKGDFLTKKWGSIQEKAQKQDFWKGVRLYSRVGLYSSGYGIPTGTVSQKRSFKSWLRFYQLKQFCLHFRQLQ